MKAAVRPLRVEPLPVAAAEPKAVAHLHVHGQRWPHDEVHLVGTGAGLKKLRDALDAVLERWTMDGDIERAKGFFAADGEGFEVHIKVRSPDGFSEEKVPYAHAFGDDA